MKQKALTLKQFIASIPEGNRIISDQDLPENFKDLSWEQKYKYVKYPTNIRIRVINVNKEHIYWAIKNKSVRRVGNQIFPQVTNTGIYVYIKSNEVCVRNLDSAHVETFLHDFGIEWFKDIPKGIIANYFTKSSVLRAILTKRIYSEETLYRFIASRLYHLKDISWRAVRTYCKGLVDGYSPFTGISIYDLKCFTKNVEKSITTYVESTDRNTLRDLLQCAAELNEVVDFTWSKKRIYEEHQRQIEIINAKEIASKDNKQIYQNVIGTSDIKLLNTEKDVFLEGVNMHHCLYRCYYHKIKAKNYIAFHMSAPEDCTFSVKLVNGFPVLDQIYLKYDRQVQFQTRYLAEHFVEFYKTELYKMFSEGKFLKEDQQDNLNPFRLFQTTIEDLNPIINDQNLPFEG